MQLLAVDGGGTQAFTRLGTENCHTLDAVQINLLLIATKNIHLQIGLSLCHGIILMCQFLTHTLDIVHRLLQGGEEMIEVAFVGIDGKALLAFYRPVAQSGHRDFLVGEIAVIGTEAQGSIGIVETHVVITFFLQGIGEALLVHALDLVVHLQRCPLWQHHIGGLAGIIAHDDHGTLLLIGMLLDFVCHEVVVGQLSLYLRRLSLMLVTGILHLFTLFSFLQHLQRTVYLTLDGINQTWVFLQFPRPVVHHAQAVL